MSQAIGWRTPLFLAGLILACAPVTPAAGAVDYVRDGGPVEFGAAELDAALRGRTPAPRIALAVSGGGAPESFRVRVHGAGAAREIRIEGADAAGAMYGALEVAETIRLGGPDAVRDLERAPHLRVRGMKFNAPLDARTPSYSDPADAAQKNIATMWDAAFWRELIDRLARDRYNLVSLWSLHPFPSLVRVPEYPDVALADVQRSKVAWKELYTLQAMGLDAPEILGNTETLRRLTIDGKIAFWREVLRYGKSRNVRFAIVTWNVFTNGIDPTRGLPPDWKNAATADYFRRSVAALLRTYPDLAGVGVTAGENMVGATAPEKEAWLAKTYGQGVLDVLAEQPERRVLFIHRQHEAGAAEIARHFGKLLDHPRVDFTYSFKYAEAHALAVTRPRFHENFLKELGGRDTMWTLRNDDVYYFRWHAPDFVRDFVRGLPAGPTRGFYYGSDGHVWGRDFLDANRPDDAPRPLELEKHAWHWRLWGRLGYEPELDNGRLTALLQERFPAADARVLFAVWQDASLVPTTVTSFHWGPLDFHWYVEACQGRPEQGQTPTGFHDVNRFISLRPHPASGMVSIPDYVKNPRATGTTPPQVAARLDELAASALAGADRLQAVAASDRELRATLEDIRALAYLGKYYAHKIRAALALAQQRAAHDPARQKQLADELNRAAQAWRLYGATAVTQYRNPLWTNRVGHVDWRQTFYSVLYDLTIVGATPAVPAIAPTPGGTILEAEDAVAGDPQQPLRTESAGFTGRGYLEFSHTLDPRKVVWNYDAPADGTYALEFRYAIRRGLVTESDLTVNGVTQPLLLWPTGGGTSWAWDRKIVTLRRGPNRIELRPGAVVNLDHLNILPWGP
jgi:hypothetical protein